jgi:hypothetical protein
MGDWGVIVLCLGRAEEGGERILVGACLLHMVAEIAEKS